MPALSLERAIPGTPPFNVKRPPNIARSCQGQPPIVQAGLRGAGRALAARTVEAIFGGNGNFDGLKAYRRDLRQRTAAFGGDAGSPHILPTAPPTWGGTLAEGQGGATAPPTHPHKLTP